MNEKRWEVSREQLRALREIRINCQMCDDCALCPLASEDDHLLCVLNGRTGLPEAWNLEELEAESNG